MPAHTSTSEKQTSRDEVQGYSHSTWCWVPGHASAHRSSTAIYFLTLAHFAENTTQAGILQQFVMHMDMYTALQQRPDVLQNAAS